jgi:hypothetical protein
MKTTFRAVVATALPLGLALGLFFVAPACPSNSSSTSAGCTSNADCPSTAVCSEGKCLLARGSSSSGGVNGGGTSAGSQGSTGGSPGGSNGGGSTNGSPGGGSTTGQVTGFTNTASSGSSGGDGGTSCSCSTSCCSQDEGSAPSGTTCSDGKYCYGTVPDGGGDFFCNDQTGKCDPFDPCNGSSGVYTCQASGGGNSGGSTGAAATVDPEGLSFVITGDTRPSTVGGAYPTQTIQAIYQDFNGLSPKPLAVVATGDFQEDGDSASATSQIDDYEAAITVFTGPTYPAMGNHECVSTSITTYCSTASGGYTTVNFTAFMQMLTDLSIPNTNGEPYYYETLTAPNGDTAKFVITAAQAWDTTQVSWLNTTLAIPSTFTFLARHEPDDATGCSNATATPNDNTTNSCPFIADVQTAINNAPVPVTLKLTGHTHELRFDTYNDAIVSGAGGVAIEAGCTTSDTIYCNYGYVYCQEMTDKTFLCSAYDWQSGLVTAPASGTNPAALMQFIAKNGIPPANSTLSYPN